MRNNPIPVLQNGEMRLAPIGTGADDAPRRAAVLLAAAGKYPVRYAAGTWVDLTQQDIPSYSQIYFDKGALHNFDLAHVATHDAVISVQVQPPSVTTLLAALPVVGSNQIVVVDAAGITVGSRLILNDPNITSGIRLAYEVTVVAGTTITLHTAITYPYPYTGGGAGTDTSVWVIPPASQRKEIRIEGNRAHLVSQSATGCDRIVQIAYAWDCAVRNLTLDFGANTGGWAGSFDQGGVGNEFYGINVYGRGVGGYGLTFENNHDGLGDKCNVRDLTGYGIGHFSNQRGRWINSVADNCAFGFVACASESGDFYGSRNCTFENDSARNCTTAGFAVGDGSERTLILGGEAINCAYGIKLTDAIVTAAGHPSHETTIMGTQIVKCPAGIVVNGGSLRNKAIGVSVMDPTGYGVYVTASGELELLNSSVAIVTATASTSLVRVDSGKFTARQCRFSVPDQGHQTYVVYCAGGTINLSDCIIDAPNLHDWSPAFQVQGTTVFTAHDLEINLKSDATELCGIYLSGANATIRIDGLIKLTGAKALLTMAGGATQAQSNVGTFVADGANPTAVAIPQITAQSVVRIYAGVTGAIVQPTYTITAGVGISVAVLPAGTYNFQLLT